MKFNVVLAGALALTLQQVAGLSVGVVCNYSYGTCTNGTQSGPLKIATTLSAALKKLTTAECLANATAKCGTECQYSAWSDAVANTQTCIATSTRTVTVPATGGGACSTYLTRESPARTYGCSVSDWERATECNEDDGTALFKRNITVPAICTSCTHALEETRRACPLVDCVLSDWVVGECNPDTQTKTVSKFIQTPARYGGAACPPLPAPREIPCGGVPCIMTEWGSWSTTGEWGGANMLARCEPGEHLMRKRTVLQPPEFGGEACGEAIEFMACPNRACRMSEWTCEACDPETSIRACTRTVLSEPVERGALCGATSENQLCRPDDCEYTPWSAWSCDTSTGIRKRTREIERFAERGGAACLNALEDRKPCEPQDCKVSDWKCGTNLLRSREIVQPAMFGGKPCPHLYEPCSPRDCILSPWESTKCTSKWGTKKSTRKIVQQGAYGGQACPSEYYWYYSAASCANDGNFP